MSSVTGATVVADPAPYLTRLQHQSCCHSSSKEASSSSGRANLNLGTKRFASVSVPPCPDRTTGSPLRIAEDIWSFTGGGSVYATDWAPKHTVGDGDTTNNTRHVAVEVRSSDDMHHSFASVGRAVGPGMIQVWSLRTSSSGTKATGNTDTAAARKKRKTCTTVCRSSPGVTNSSNPNETTAAMTLGLAHGAKHAFDVKWRKGFGDSHDSHDSQRKIQSNKEAIGDLAVALGNGRVEVWVVPVPLARPRSSRDRTGDGTDDGLTSRSHEPPVVVTCDATFIGVVPKNAGVPLCLDWANSFPFQRLCAGTSAGAVVMWCVGSAETGGIGNTPRGSTHRSSTPTTPSPQLPVLQIASTGCPQRSVAWAPASDDPGHDAETDASHLVMAAGHGMNSPAVYDTREPFTSVCGRRGDAFGGSAALTSAKWCHAGCVVTGSDDGAACVFDFFHEDRIRNPVGDESGRVGKRQIEVGEPGVPLGEDTVVVVVSSSPSSAKDPTKQKTTKQKQKVFTITPSLALDVGSVWSVDCKATSKGSVTSLLLSGTGRGGTRIAICNVARGIRKVPRGGNDEARRNGAPTDFGFCAGSAEFFVEKNEKEKKADGNVNSEDEELAGNDDDDNVLAVHNHAARGDSVTNNSDVADLLRVANSRRRGDCDSAKKRRFALPATRGANGAASCVGDASCSEIFEPSDDSSKETTQTRYAPTRCVSWLDPSTPVADDAKNAWCVSGDDAGFLRFLRFDGDSVAICADAVARLERHK